MSQLIVFSYLVTIEIVLLNNLTESLGCYLQYRLASREGYIVLKPSDLMSASLFGWLSY